MARTPPTRRGWFPVSILSVLLLLIVATALIVDLAWKAWYAGLADTGRNPWFRRAWSDYVDHTPPRREGERLIILLSNSQGYGREMACEDTYAGQLRSRFAVADTPTRIVNWSVPGGQFTDLITLAAAARSKQPSSIIAVVSPGSFTVPESVERALALWVSDTYRLLADPTIREALPEPLLQEARDLRLRIDIAAGRMGAAWRIRTLPSALLACNPSLAPFFHPQESINWFGRQPGLDAWTPVWRTSPNRTFEMWRYEAFLDQLTQAAPVSILIDMPLTERVRAGRTTPPDILAAAAAARGVRYLDLSADIPDQSFITATHLNLAGHDAFAARLARELP